MKIIKLCFKNVRTATKLSDSPSGKSPAATGDTQAEKLAELSGDGLTCAPRGAAGKSCFARSTRIFRIEITPVYNRKMWRLEWARIQLRDVHTHCCKDAAGRVLSNQ